jgi:hypothetical protein
VSDLHYSLDTRPLNPFVKFALELLLIVIAVIVLMECLTMELATSR